MGVNCSKYTYSLLRNCLAYFCSLRSLLQFLIFYCCIDLLLFLHHVFLVSRMSRIAPQQRDVEDLNVNAKERETLLIIANFP